MYSDYQSHHREVRSNGYESETYWYFLSVMEHKIYNIQTKTFDLKEFLYKKYDKNNQTVCYLKYPFSPKSDKNNETFCYRPPLLSNNLHYVTLISISLHSAFHIK